MGWIALVLGVFLFYRYVERAHKVVFFKVAAGLTGFTMVLGGGYWAVNSWKESRPVNLVPTGRPALLLGLTSGLTIEECGKNLGTTIYSDPKQKEIKSFFGPWIDFQTVEIRGVTITEVLRRRLSSAYAVVKLFDQNAGIRMDFIDGHLYEVGAEYTLPKDPLGFEAVRARAEAAFQKTHPRAKKAESQEVKKAYAYLANTEEAVSASMWVNPNDRMLSFSVTDNRPFDSIREGDLARDSKVFGEGH